MNAYYNCGSLNADAEVFYNFHFAFKLPHSAIQSFRIRHSALRITAKFLSFVNVLTNNGPVHLYQTEKTCIPY
jgi:hypothetical protein